MLRCAVRTFNGTKSKRMCRLHWRGRGILRYPNIYMLCDGGSLVFCVQFSFGSRKKIKSENLLSRLSLVKTDFSRRCKRRKKSAPNWPITVGCVRAICSILWPDLCVDSSRTSLQFFMSISCFCALFRVAVFVGCGSSLLLLLLLIGRPRCYFFYSFFPVH